MVRSLLIHCIEDPLYVFQEKKLRSLVLNFHFHVSVGDLYIPQSVHLFCCSKIGGLLQNLLHAKNFLNATLLLPTLCRPKWGKIPHEINNKNLAEAKTASWRHLVWKIEGKYSQSHY